MTLSQHPTHFVSPLRASGSAIEMLFGQYKYSAGGKFDSSNYATARASCLVKGAVSGHHSGKGYCDEQLGTAVPQLVKKKYSTQPKK